MVFYFHLPDKTCMIYGTLTLDISQRMLYNKHPYMSWVYPLSPFLFLYLPAKDVLWGRWLINHFYHLIKGLLDLLHWFTPISLVLCQLNHVCMPSMFLYLLKTILVMHLLHSYVTKMLLHSIFSLWLAGLRPSLVNHSPLYIQTGGEFLGKELQAFFLSRGITHQTSVPHISQQNSHAERFNRTLLEKAEVI